MVVAGARTLVLSLAQIEAAATLSAARLAGWRMAYREPELAFLAGQAGATMPASRGIPPHHLQNVSLSRFRELRGALRWTSMWRAPLTWLAPQASAISENKLLRQAAAKTPIRLDVRYAQSLFRSFAPDEDGAVDRDRAMAAAEALAGLLAHDGIAEDIAIRQRQLCLHTATDLCLRAARDLSAARNARLPRNLWAGTAGPWPNRVISLEVLRRGGTVRRFDHGGGRGLNRFPAWPVVLDLCLSTTFVMASQGLADRLRAQGVDKMMPQDKAIEIASGDGDPSFAHLPAAFTRKRPSRPRVLYAPGLLRGLKQTVPAQMPDVLYLDWQYRLIKQLQKLPIDLVCRPHPNMRALGSLRTQPIADLIEPSPVPFESSLPEVDVVLLDQPHSTTFYSAICTDRPIALIDFRTPYFDTAATELIDARCRIIPAGFDARNRPMVDLQAVAAALLDEPEPVDNTAVRKLLIGELSEP